MRETSEKLRTNSSCTSQTESEHSHGYDAPTLATVDIGVIGGENVCLRLSGVRPRGSGIRHFEEELENTACHLLRLFLYYRWLFMPIYGSGRFRRIARVGEA